MMRPSPFLPRRKSTSRSACWPRPARASAKRDDGSRIGARRSAWSNSVTRTALPSICVSKVCGLLRLKTTRVRLPACTTLRLRSAGSLTSCAVRPRPLPVSRKSSAMRGGLLIANPAGGLASGDLSDELHDGATGSPFRHGETFDAVGALRHRLSDSGHEKQRSQQQCHAPSGPPFGFESFGRASFASLPVVVLPRRAGSCSIARSSRLRRPARVP